MQRGRETKRGDGERGKLPAGDGLLVDSDHLSDGALVDVERREVRQEVVSSKEAEQHKVVDHSLLVIREAELAKRTSRGKVSS